VSGIAGSSYTSYTFTLNGTRRFLGFRDISSSTERFASFVSSGNPFHIVATSSTTRTILFVEADLAVQTHVLNAYPRADGPDIVVGKTAQARVSGYLILEENDSSFGLSSTGVKNGEDPTAANESALPGGGPFIQHSSAYAGVFIPIGGSSYTGQAASFSVPDPSPTVTFTAGMGAFTGPGGIPWGAWGHL
jgi:hypothetical protein